MPTTEPTQEQPAAFAKTGQTMPFTMVDLLKFRKEAIYGAEGNQPRRRAA
jgi:hypothetical protein